MKTFLAAMLTLVSHTFGYSKVADKHTVGDVDIERYMGLWYEIARFDVSFESGMSHVTAHYTLMPNGEISVVNTGYKKGKKKQAKGRAHLADPKRTDHLKVSFFLWFYGDYYILELDKANYSYALIGSKSDKYLWILSRTPTMNNRDLNHLLESAKRRGYDTANLVFCDHRKPKH